MKKFYLLICLLFIFSISTFAQVGNFCGQAPAYGDADTQPVVGGGRGFGPFPAAGNNQAEFDLRYMITHNSDGTYRLNVEFDVSGIVSGTQIYFSSGNGEIEFGPLNAYVMYGGIEIRDNSNNVLAYYPYQTIDNSANPYQTRFILSGTNYTDPGVIIPFAAFNITDTIHHNFFVMEAMEINQSTPSSQLSMNTSIGGGGTTTWQCRTDLPQVRSVLLGTNGNPGAIGTTNNDDYTNKTVLGNIPASGGTASANTIDYVNTLRNPELVAESFILTAPTVPSGFTVEVSENCASYTTISGGGSLTTSSIPAQSNQNYCVRVTAPSGSPTYTPFSTIIRAQSVTDATAINDTIDRLYTGFVVTNKTATVNNPTGVGGASDPVPGAIINYFVNYQNIANSPFGSGNVDLTATNFVITEDGNALPNNWATYTTHEPGNATDSLGGSITGDTSGSNYLTDTIASLAPGVSGTFAFKRKIK